MTVMDVGCGMGFFAIPAARLVGPAGRVIAVDLQQQMLDVLMRRAAKADVADRITPHRCRSDALGLNESVDFALAFYSAHEVPDQRRLLREIHAVLGQSGKLLVVEPIGHVTQRDFDEMISLAAEVGLDVRERPRVRMSRAAVLDVRQALQPDCAADAVG